MHRQPLLSLLDHYEERHPDEHATTALFREFVIGNHDCFERSLALGHLTGSAWILDKASERVLLTHHRKLDRWLQPGGHADGDPDLLAVAMREGLEETGLDSLESVDRAIFDLDIHPIPARGEVPEHLHYDVRFLLKVAGEERYVVSEESHDLAWVALGSLEEYSSEDSMLRMRAKSDAYFRTA